MCHQKTTQYVCHNPKSEENFHYEKGFVECEKAKKSKTKCPESEWTEHKRIASNGWCADCIEKIDDFLDKRDEYVRKGNGPTSAPSDKHVAYAERVWEFAGTGKGLEGADDTPENIAIMDMAVTVLDSESPEWEEYRRERTYNFLLEREKSRMEEAKKIIANIEEKIEESEKKVVAINKRLLQVKKKPKIGYAEGKHV